MARAVLWLVQAGTAPVAVLCEYCVGELYRSSDSSVDCRYKITPNSNSALAAQWILGIGNRS